MEREFEKLLPGSRCERAALFEGIELSYTDIVSDSLPHRHESLPHIMQINYCRSGQIVWDMRHGGSIFLNPGDFSVHTLDVCADSTLEFPTGQYRGLTISVDLRRAAAHPPELIAGTGIFRELPEKLCPNDTASFLAGNEQTERIFSAFYDKTEKLRPSFQRLKALELLLYLVRTEPAPQNGLAEYSPEHIAVVREIHDRLLRHMERRVTIEELSRQHLINPTTLKSAFKAVYGTSIAAHVKEHRMEQAAKMLRETDMTVAEIAQAVGYESQSKFTTAFKARYETLPTEYRKQG